MLVRCAGRLRLCEDWMQAWTVRAALERVLEAEQADECAPLSVRDRAIVGDGAASATTIAAITKASETVQERRRVG